MINRFSILFIMSVVFLSSCEEEYIPGPSAEGPKYVVEGYVEAGETTLPPYLILTKTFDFYNEIGPDQFSDAFVNNADVRVSDGTIEVVYQEVCILDLPPELRKEAAAQFGFNSDSLEINYCVYIDLLNILKPQEGKTYNLRIMVDSHLITASAYIPYHIPIDSLFFQAPPGEPNDSLAQLRVVISDPPLERNYYRYLGSTNGNSYKSVFSVEEDLFFDGKSFEFQLLNPETTSGDVDPDEFGLYFVGDTISVKWCSIDEGYFNFWNTLEFGNANEGPFSSYTRLESNINGGLGVWGGLSVSYYTRLVEY